MEAKKLAYDIMTILDYHRVPQTVGAIEKTGDTPFGELAHVYVLSEDLQNMQNALAHIRQRVTEEMMKPDPTLLHNE